MVSRRLVTKIANGLRALECNAMVARALHTNLDIDLGRACEKVGSECPTDELNDILTAIELSESTNASLHVAINVLIAKHNIEIPGPGDPGPTPIPLTGPGK